MITESRDASEEANRDIASQFELTEKHQPNDTFRPMLVAHLLYLLEKNAEKLWQALYRIDVSETKVKTLFQQEQGLPAVAEKLADLIIERQLQKVASRRAYREAQSRKDNLRDELP